MGLNIAELIEDFEETGKGAGEGAGVNFLDNFVLMPKEEGVVVVRILPPGNDLPMLAGGLCMSTRIHTINDRKVHCRRERVKGKKYPMGDCRICDHYNWLYRQADELKRKGDKDGAENLIREARAIKPVERYYFNAIVRKVRKENGEDEFNVGPKILSIGKTLKDRILRAILGDEAAEEAPLGDITDPLKGRDFKIFKEIRKSEGESFPNYDKSKFLEPSPLGEPDKIKVWMGNLHDLASLRTVKTIEEVERELRIHLGAEQEEKADAYNPSAYSAGGTTKTVVVGNSVVEDDPVHGGYTPGAYSSTKDEPSAVDIPNVAMDNESFFSALKSM